MAVDSENGTNSSNNRLQEDCKDLCASLVEVTSDQTVTLVHSTTKQYLVRDNFISLPEAHGDLAVACIIYLSMEEFDKDRPDEEIKKSFLQGSYAFSEYAVCFWPLHIESALKDSSVEDSNSEMIRLLSECFETFLTLHWDSTGKAEPVSTTLQQHLSNLRQYTYFSQACEAIATAKSRLRPANKAPEAKDPLQLSRVMTKIRSVIECTISSSTLNNDEQGFVIRNYGSNHYKCARFNCQFFNRGFASNTQRDQHTAKHDRSFTCVHEGCAYEIIGFTNIKDLQRHTLEQHGVSHGPDKLEFPEENTSIKDISQMTTGTFRCDKCPKQFTRDFNLRAHLKTHTNERPLACEDCDMAFVRFHDYKRHTALHTGDKKFVCRGELKQSPGKTWGCGRQFARADALGLML